MSSTSYSAQRVCAVTVVLVVAAPLYSCPLSARLGYDTTFQLPLKIVGRNGVELNERWKPHPVSYLSVAVDGFPNLFMSFGPNSGVGSGSLLALMEFEVMYAVQATAKMQRERLKSIEVKAEALQDFDQYLEVSP